MKRKEIIILFAIIFLAFVLRFYKLGDIPFGFHRDEAFLGYNAYSILKTGMDMSGNFLPLHLESFLFSPAGYVYFSVPFIFLFDLSPFSVRFASAFFGSLTVIVVFFLVLELFKKEKYKKQLALISSFLLAISPWNINLARTATENTIIVFLISLAVYFLLFAKAKKNNIFNILAFIFFLISFYTYQAPRAFLPLLIPVFFIFFYKSFSKKTKILIISLFIALILIPLCSVIFSSNQSVRLRTLNIFGHGQANSMLSQYIAEDGISSVNILTTRFFHNKPFEFFQEASVNYFKHFSFDFLFYDLGFPDRYRIPSSGLVYLFELPLIIFGIYKLLSSKTKEGLFLFSWILIAPIGSALTFDDIPNMQRTLIIFPALSIVSALGLIYMLSLFKNKTHKKMFLVPFLIASLFFFLFYLHQYFVHVSLYRPWYRQDGYKELVVKVNKLLPNYKNAVITNRESAPAIFFLFFNKYDPKTFQKETRNTDKSATDSIDFSKYVFSNEECPLREIVKLDGTVELSGKREALFVNSGLCKNKNNLGRIKVIDTIKRKDGSAVFILVEVM